MSRLNSDAERQEDLVVSIRSLAVQATTLAVESMIDAARAEAGGDWLAVADHVCRLAAGVAFVTGEIAELAHELDLSSAGETLVAAAGIAVTGLQSSLLSIAQAVQDIAEDAEADAIFAAADTLRTAALELDDLLPSFQPSM